MKKSLIFLPVLLLFSCTSLIKFINGEKEPQIETPKTIQRFISENDLKFKTEKILYLKNESVKRKLAPFKSYHNGLHIVIPDIFLFDENGMLVDEDIAGGCFANRPDSKEKDFYELVYELNEDKKSNHSLSELKGIFIDENGNNTFPFNENRKTAILLWAKYKGKKWAKRLKIANRLLKTSTEDIDIYYLNLDPNKHW